MEYKPSIFNKVINKEDYIIVFNSLTGYRSLCKINKHEYHDVAESLIYQQLLSTNNLPLFLADANIFVAKNIDERVMRSFQK